MTINVAVLKSQLTEWLQASRAETLRLMTEPVSVATKSNRRDLVTNVDKTIQAFLLDKIQTAYPEAHIVGEEGFEPHHLDLGGLVFFVDPIDGTMNFVKMRTNFATMIGVYWDGQAILGAILDVMADKLVIGGPDVPPEENGFALPEPPDRPLEDALIGLSGPLAIKDVHHIGAVGLASSGTRVSGSAGMEFLAIARGQVIGYVSLLQPWDIAAGMAIGAGFGLKVTHLDGSAIDFAGREFTVAAMPTAHETILSIVNAD